MLASLEAAGRLDGVGGPEVLLGAEVPHLVVGTGRLGSLGGDVGGRVLLLLLLLLLRLMLWLCLLCRPTTLGPLALLDPP